MSGPVVPLININGVSCSYRMPKGRFAQSEGSPAEGPQVTIHYMCAWGDRWNLVQALRGTCLTGADGKTTVRTAPYALPDNTNLVCVSTGAFEYIGSGADASGNLAGALAVVPANFSPVPWGFQDGSPTDPGDPSGQAWTVTKLKPSVEVYQPSGGTYFLGPFPSATPLDEATVGFLRANIEIQVTRKFMATLPLLQICSGMGMIASNTMQFGSKIFTGIGGGLLLAASEESEPYFDCMGNPCLDYTLTFLGRLQASWNSAQDRSGNWQRVSSNAAGTGNPPFGSYDMTLIPR
jgi:hypothetical protein